MSFNWLTGSILSEIGDNCGKLEHLELSGNFLVGGIPGSLGNCSGLQTLVLYSNLLEEVIPVELGKLGMLEVLDVSRNSLSGSIPSQLGNCSELSILVFTNLWDPLPRATSLEGNVSLGQLASATPEYNYFEGEMPVEIITLPKLRLLWAPRATLEGRFPSNWGPCNSLEMVNFASNYFTGGISEGLGSCNKLQFLDLSEQADWRAYSENVSGNQLSGLIPLFQYPNCSSTPSLNGYRSETFDSSSVYLQFFASRARDETPLPLFDDVANLAIVHNFGDNNFAGTFSPMPISPERLGKQTVYAFLACGNNLTGPFPGVLFDKCSQL